MKPKVIAIAGPTASGKTAMAIKIAHELDGEIVSADSRLVYKGFNIACAKPSLDEREGIPHHLIDIVEPEVDYTAGDYARDAKKAVDEIISRGKTPVVAGGTGLYFRVFLEHYNLPQVDTDYEYRKCLENLSRDELLNKLKSVDKIAFDKISDDTSKRRIIRILELIKSLKKPLSEVNTVKEPEYDVIWKCPELKSREWLYERINKRVDIMVEQGIVEETKYLLQKHGRVKNFTETIGYKEILAYIDGNWSFEEAVDKLKQHTRNYAKRQLTWFRRNSELNIRI